MKPNEIDDGWEDWEDVRLRRSNSIMPALSQRCKHHDNYGLGVFGRIFYTFKALVCVCLNLQSSLWAENCVDAVAIYHPEQYAGEDGTVYSWTELAVGHGVFSNWHYDIYRNSN